MHKSLLLVSCLILFSCQETTMSRIGARVDIFPVVEVHRWEVVQQDEMVGVLRLLRVQKPNFNEEFYQVQRPDGQICGEIDLRGRGWRSEPFKKEMVFIGMGSMEENLAKLLEVGGKVTTQAWSDKATAEASMRTEGRRQATHAAPAKPEPASGTDAKKPEADAPESSKDGR